MMLLCKNTLEAEGRVVCKGELASEPSSSEPGSQVDGEGFWLFFLFVLLLSFGRVAHGSDADRSWEVKKKKKANRLEARATPT